MYLFLLRVGVISGNEREKKKNEQERKGGRIPKPGRMKGASKERRGRRHLPKVQKGGSGIVLQKKSDGRGHSGEGREKRLGVSTRQ